MLTQVKLNEFEYQLHIFKLRGWIIDYKKISNSYEIRFKIGLRYARNWIKRFCEENNLNIEKSVKGKMLISFSESLIDNKKDFIKLPLSYFFNEGGVK